MLDANALLTGVRTPADENGRSDTNAGPDTRAHDVERTGLALLRNRRSTTNVMASPPAAAAEPCLSNCLTTTPEISSQLWTMLDAAQRETSHQGTYRAYLIRQRSVVQVHLGPPARIPLPPGATLRSQAVTSLTASAARGTRGLTVAPNASRKRPHPGGRNGAPEQSIQPVYRRV